MNLARKLGELEAAAARMLIGKRCKGCGFPNPRGTRMVIQWGEVEPRCQVCRAWVDQHGRAAGPLTGKGPTKIIILKLGPRASAATLPGAKLAGP